VPIHFFADLGSMGKRSPSLFLSPENVPIHFFADLGSMGSSSRGCFFGGNVCERHREGGTKKVCGELFYVEPMLAKNVPLQFVLNDNLIIHVFLTQTACPFILFCFLLKETSSHSFFVLNEFDENRFSIHFCC
jgi:hypothetical protein